MCDIATASACMAEDEIGRSLLSEFGCYDQDGVERIDTGRLTLEHPAVAARLERFASVSKLVLAEPRQGVGGSNFAIVERTLVAWRQRDNANGRSDLTLQYAEADKVPLLGELLALVTAKKCDWAAVARRGFGWDAVVTPGAKNTNLVTFKVGAAKGWPVSWGGNARSNELYRRLELEVNHAAWRDRCVRRLVGVNVVAAELWADPSQN